MEAIPWRVRVGVVIAGYVSVLAISSALIFARYRLYAQHPEDVQTAGGMYAAGDWMLAMFVASMLLAATIVLIIVIRNVERAYTRLAHVLFGISLTAPLSLGLLSIPAVSQSSSAFGFACMYRMATSPIFIFGFAVSRVAAKFKVAKRWTTYATAVEALTFVVGISGLFLAGR